MCISLYSVILCTVLKIANLLLSRYGSGVVDDEYQCGSCGHGEPHGWSPSGAAFSFHDIFLLTSRSCSDTLSCSDALSWSDTLSWSMHA